VFFCRLMSHLAHVNIQSSVGMFTFMMFYLYDVYLYDVRLFDCLSIPCIDRKV